MRYKTLAKFKSCNNYNFKTKLLAISFYLQPKKSTPKIDNHVTYFRRRSASLSSWGKGHETNSNDNNQEKNLHNDDTCKYKVYNVRRHQTKILQLLYISVKCVVMFLKKIICFRAADLQSCG